MFKPGDVVTRRDGEGPNMTVEKVEKCLDCTGVIVSCVWIPLTGGALRGEFTKGKLDMVTPAPTAPRRAGYGDIFARIEREISGMRDPVPPQQVRFTIPPRDAARYISNAQLVNTDSITRMWNEPITVAEGAAANGMYINPVTLNIPEDDPY